MCHTLFLDFFGGALTRIIPDNLKTRIIKPRACYAWIKGFIEAGEEWLTVDAVRDANHQKILPTYSRGNINYRNDIRSNTIIKARSNWQLPFHYHCHSLPPTNAYSYHPTMQVFPLHFIHNGHHQSGTCAANWMPQ